jgi:hypothetical protein
MTAVSTLIHNACSYKRRKEEKKEGRTNYNGTLVRKREREREKERERWKGDTKG